MTVSKTGINLGVEIPERSVIMIVEFLNTSHIIGMWISGLKTLYSLYTILSIFLFIKLLYCSLP